jgi:hypothetical protein
LKLSFGACVHTAIPQGPCQNIDIFKHLDLKNTSSKAIAHTTKPSGTKNVFNSGVF